MQAAPIFRTRPLGEAKAEAGQVWALVTDLQLFHSDPGKAPPKSATRQADWSSA